MADPVVGIVNGVPTSGTGNITTLGQTLLDGANATLGVTTGAAVTTSVAGTIQQYLRGIVSLLVSGITVASHAVTNAGTFAVQASTTAADGSNVTLGSKTDAKSSASDATSTSSISIWKQISFSIQAAAASLATLVSGAITPGTAGTPTASVLSIQGIASMTPVLVNQAAVATSSGTTPSRINAAASTNATNLKASAGNLYHIDVFNAAAYNVFLKLYNKASAPTVGTDTPIMTIPVQAGGGYSKNWPMGLSFTTGISYAITKLQADSDTTFVVAGDLTGNTVWI